MMGGPGSGSGYRWRSRNTVEGHRSIDIRHFKREGYLPGPRSFSLHWSRNVESIGHISVRVVDRYETVLSYRSRSYGAENVKVLSNAYPSTGPSVIWAENAPGSGVPLIAMELTAVVVSPSFSWAERYLPVATATILHTRANTNRPMIAPC